jgi:hypothetical protein
MPRPLPHISHALAARHEALWLRVTSLHKDITTIAAKKPDAPVGDTERVLAEGLISDGRPFLSARHGKLPVAAQNFSGLAVQLGQVLAQLDDYENRHAAWNARQNCRCWRVEGEPLPIARLRPDVAVAPLTTASGEDLRAKLLRRTQNRERQIFEDGFHKGLSARRGPPPEPETAAVLPPAAETYPRGR